MGSFIDYSSFQKEIPHFFLSARFCSSRYRKCGSFGIQHSNCILNGLQTLGTADITESDISDLAQKVRTESPPPRACECVHKHERLDSNRPHAHHRHTALRSARGMPIVNITPPGMAGPPRGVRCLETPCAHTQAPSGSQPCTNAPAETRTKHAATRLSGRLL